MTSNISFSNFSYVLYVLFVSFVSFVVKRLSQTPGPSLELCNDHGQPKR